MTISSTDRKAGPFTGDDASTVFSFAFKVFTSADLLVIKLNTSTGVETTLAITTDYTVSLNVDQNAHPGGTITLTSVLASGYNLTITTALSYLQSLVLTNQGGFYPAVLNAALDRITIFAQQLDEELSRALKYPVSDSDTISATMPAYAQRAGTVLAFDSTGAPVVGPEVDDVGTVFDNIADIGTVADNISNVNTVAGVSGNVTTVATNIADVSTVSSGISNVNTVAADLNEPVSEINTVAGSITNVDTVGGNIADVNTVAAISAHVSTVAGINADVTAVANNSANINIVAANDANVTAVANNKTNIDTVAADKTNIDTVAANKTNIDTVAGINADVSTVAGISADVSTAALNVADITNFADVYYGPSATDPTTRKDSSALQTGDLYFNTATRKMRVYSTSTSSWADAVIVFAPTVEQFSGTGSETNFTLAAGPGSAEALIVSISGVIQAPTVDYTVAGTTLTFTSAPPLGTNNITVQSFSAGSLACSDAAFSASWSGVTDTPPSKNAVYNKIETLPRQNLLTNSRLNVWSNGTVCDAISGAAPVTDGANAALVNNLLTNGGFDSATTGWTPYTDTTLSSEAGGKTGNCLKVLSPGGGGGAACAYQVITTVPGKLYYFSAWAKNGDSNYGAIFVGKTIWAGEYYLTPVLSDANWTRYSCVFEAETTTTYITLWGASTSLVNKYYLFDSVICVEMTRGCIAADTLALDGWGKGTDASIWRQHNDATYTKAGSLYSLKVTAGANPCPITWPLGYSEKSHLAEFAGKTFALGCWVYASEASSVRLKSYDSVNGYRYGNYHSGTPGWEWLEYSNSVGAASTVTFFGWDVAAGKTAYFSQPMLVFGSSIGEGNWMPKLNEFIPFDKYVASNTYNNKSGFSSLGDWTTINLEADSNGAIPKGIKNVSFLAAVCDSASFSTQNTGMVFRANSSQALQGVCSSGGLGNDIFVYSNISQVCSSNGDIDIIYTASGSGTLDIAYLRYYGVQF